MESCQSMKIQSKIIEKERVLFYYNHVYNFYFRYFIKLGLMEQPNIQQTDQSTLMTINENRHDDFKPKSRTTESEHEVEIPVSKVQQSISNFGNSENSRQNEQGEAPEVENVKLQQMEIQKQEMSDDSEEEKSGIVVKSGRERKFKRSTNNSHKKFVSVARRWLFKNNISTLKVAFQTKYNAFRSTRTYFFIILAFIKTVMDVQKQKQFQEFFFKLVSKKIGDYQKQIQNTENPNLKHFRQDEITDLKYSIKACDVYFQGDMDKSIQCVYKKDKISIVKKQHYEEALKTVKGIEQELLQPGSFQKMIAEFGKKKQKRTSSNQSNFSGEKQQDYMRHMFLFPEMFGISDGLNFKQIVETCKKPQLDKMTEECQEEEKQQISFQLKDRTQQIASKLEFSSSQGKIKKNIIILHPQLENKQTKLFQGLQIKSESMAFKPFQKQPQVESTNLN